jgi:hypothetical protein
MALASELLSDYRGCLYLRKGNRDMVFSNKARYVLVLLFAGLSFCGAVSARGPFEENCTKALALSKTYAAAATAAATETNASVALAVIARAHANVLVKSSAVALTSVQAHATVEAASKLCVIGIACASAESIAIAFSKAEASAQAAAKAFASALAAAKAASFAQALAIAQTCRCSHDVNQELLVAQRALSAVQSSALQYGDVMANSEDQRHKVALILVKVAARAEEVAGPQCATCRSTGQRASATSEKSTNGSFAKASSFVQISGVRSSFTSTSRS